MPRLLVVTHSDFDPSSRFRLMQFFPYLAAAGWQVDHRPIRPSLYRKRRFGHSVLRRWEMRSIAALRRASLFGDFIRAGEYDAVIVGRELPHLVSFLARRNPRLIFDFDDAIHLGSSRAAIMQLIHCAKAVVVGNELLAEAAARWTGRLHVIPTVVDPDRYAMQMASDGAAGALRVGWLGSDYSIRETLFPFLSMLAELQDKLGFELVIVSRPRPILPDIPLRWRFVEWSPEVERGIAGIFDVGIMPLVDTPVQRAKCGTKLLQYMAAGLPVIASPVGVNCRIVDPGVNGFLAASRDDWHRALASLAADRDLRQRFGSAGRARVEADYSIGRWLPSWLALLDSVAGVR
jgi:glycosyltransferase involved in cell wall biosynthesis